MYTINKLGVEKLDTILALEKLCFPEPDLWKEEDWRRLLKRDRDTYYAMMDGGRLIGNVFICNWLGERDYVKIMNVFRSSGLPESGRRLPSAEPGHRRYDKTRHATFLR